MFKDLLEDEVEILWGFDADGEADFRHKCKSFVFDYNDQLMKEKGKPAMKKIIDVPEDCEIVVFAKDVYRGEGGKIGCYTPISDVAVSKLLDESLTADGLTLREFAEKIGEGKHIEWNFGEWREPIQSNDGILLHLLSVPEDMKCYRIKPEVMHYRGAFGIPACHKTGDVPRTRYESEVTCPKCLAELNKGKIPAWIKPGAKCFFNGHLYEVVDVTGGVHDIKIKSDFGCVHVKCSALAQAVLKPWTFETAPMVLEGENDERDGFFKASSGLGDEWGFYSTKENRWLDFETMLKSVRQSDGSPCGQWVIVLEEDENE